MSDEKYRVIFSGQIARGQDIDEVKEKVAKIFKLPLEQANRLFKGNQVKIKDGITYPEAEKYKKAFEATGAICQIEAIGQALAQINPGQQQENALDERAALAESIRDLGDLGRLTGLNALHSIRILFSIKSEENNSRVSRKEPSSPQNEATEEDIATIVMKYRDRLQGKYCFFAPNIPQNKVIGAISKYAKTVTQDEKILMLADNTVWGSAKEGILLTDKKLYAFSLSNSPKTIELCNILSAAFVEKSNTLFINELLFYVNVIIDKPLMYMMTQMLQEITTKFHIQEKLSSSPAQRERVAEIAFKYQGRMQSKYVFFAPNIPRDKLMNATSQYAMQITHDEKALVMLDNTAFGGAKDGVLLTDKRIYAHDMGSPPKNIEFPEIQTTLFDDKANKLFINNVQFYTNNLIDKPTMQIFAEMLREIFKLFTVIRPLQ